jgi:glycerate kinase
VIGVCDVACPLYGPDGAAERFAAQKGASVDQVAQLDRATRAFSQAAGCATGKRLNGLKYGGAGGGLAAGLHLGCIARLVGGLDWLVRKCGLVRIVKGVDLVITGEGRFDETSLQGKAAYRLLEIAAGEGKPVLLASGICNVPVDRLRDLGFRAWASAADPHSGDGDHGRSVARLGAQLAGALARAAITRTP